MMPQRSVRPAPGIEGLPFCVFRIPRSSGRPTLLLQAPSRRCSRVPHCHPVCESSTRHLIAVAPQPDNQGVGARSSRGQIPQPADQKKQGLGCQVTDGRGVESAGRRRGGSAARSFLARCRGNARPAWCGCAVPASRSLTKFDLQARVGFDFFHDLVVARHHVADRDAPAFGRELAQLVKVQGYELFNLENVDALAQASVLG